MWCKARPFSPLSLMSLQTSPMRTARHRLLRCKARRLEKGILQEFFQSFHRHIQDECVGQVCRQQVMAAFISFAPLDSR